MRLAAHLPIEGLDNPKVCRQCKRDLKVKDFYSNNRNLGGLSNICKTCVASNARLRKYKINSSEYNNLLIEQGGRCAICSKAEDDLFIDHHHSTGTSRGLLCRSCNFVVGACENTDIDILMETKRYLSVWNARIAEDFPKGPTEIA